MFNSDKSRQAEETRMLLGLGEETSPDDLKEAKAWRLARAQEDLLLP